MQIQQWPEVYKVVMAEAAQRVRGSRRVPDFVIVLTLLWAAYSNKPMGWACRRGHWPVWMCRWVRWTPSPTTMSRRLYSKTVQAFLDAVLARAQEPLPRSLCVAVDGKPLVIGGGSKDRQAGYGRAVGGKARGYKLHTLLELSGGWRRGGSLPCT